MAISTPSGCARPNRRARSPSGFAASRTWPSTAQCAGAGQTLHERSTPSSASCRPSAALDYVSTKANHAIRFGRYVRPVLYSNPFRFGVRFEPENPELHPSDKFRSSRYQLDRQEAKPTVKSTNASVAADRRNQAANPRSGAPAAPGLRAAASGGKMDVAVHGHHHQTLSVGCTLGFCI